MAMVLTVAVSLGFPADYATAIWISKVLAVTAIGGVLLRVLASLLGIGIGLPSATLHFAQDKLLTQNVINKKSPTFAEDLIRGVGGVYLDSANASLDINFSPLIKII